MLKLVGSVALLAWSTSAHAEGSQPLRPLIACKAVAEPATRLSCFDSEAERIERAIAAGAIVIYDRSEVTQARRSLFGLALPNLHLFARDGSNNDPADTVNQLDTTVAAARPSSYGRWLMTLAEGGTWETTDATLSLYVKVGQPVVITRGGIGGYRATIGKTARVSVRRVR